MSTQSLTPNAPELIVIFGEQELRLPAGTDPAELPSYVAMLSPEHAALPMVEGVREEHTLVYKTVTFGGQAPAVTAVLDEADLDAGLEGEAPAATGATEKLAATGVTEKLEPNAPTKIMIYEGQETRVPVEIDNTVVRDFIAQTFPHLATATFNEGVREEGGLVYRTVELVKQAGRKGADTAADTVVDLLAALPPTRVSKAPMERFDVRALLAGQMTFGAAIAERRNLRKALEDLERAPRTTLPVADRLAALPAVPLEQPLVW